MSEPQVITLGCRLNAFESELMRQHGSEAGLDDAVIINTCTVTAEAERQSRQTVRRAIRDNPKSKIVVTGCAAQLDPEGFAAIDGVDRVIGNSEKLEPTIFGSGDHPTIDVADIMTVRETAPHLINGFDGRARAFIQIQQGCDHRCTFCIIPFARGPNRSVPVGAIAEQIRKLVAAGFGEVVLTGVDIASYGGDLPGNPSLGELVRRLLAVVPELKRLRLSSIDPAVMDDALFQALAEEDRLMPHLHLSLQAMDDMVLKRMKRRHSVADAMAFAERARTVRPDVIFGADLIAGFPTETDEMFATTVENLKTLGVTYFHVFPYSERPGTPAANMPTVPKGIRKRRAEVLRNLGTEALSTYLGTRTGSLAQVLIEKNGIGFSEHYASVQVSDSPAPGSIVQARIDQADHERLYATLTTVAA